MPAISFSPDDFSAGSFGVQAGPHRITESYFTIHQFPANKETGKKSDPFVALAEVFVPIDPTTKKVIGEAATEYFGVGGLDKKNKATWEQTGFAPGENPDTPIKLSHENIGKKYPYLIPVGNSTGLNGNTKAARFITELVKLGFDKSKLATGNIGVIAGTEGDVYMVEFKNDGTGDDGKPLGATKIPSFKAQAYNPVIPVKFGYDNPGFAIAETKTNAAAAGSSATVSNDGVLAYLKAFQRKFSGQEVTVAEVKKGILGIHSKWADNYADIGPKPDGPVREAFKAMLEDGSLFTMEGADELAVLDGGKVQFA